MNLFLHSDLSVAVDAESESARSVAILQSVFVGCRNLIILHIDPF